MSFKPYSGEVFCSTDPEKMHGASFTLLVLRGDSNEESTRRHLARSPRVKPGPFSKFTSEWLFREMRRLRPPKRRPPGHGHRINAGPPAVPGSMSFVGVSSHKADRVPPNRGVPAALWDFAPPCPGERELADRWIIPWISASLPTLQVGSDENRFESPVATVQLRRHGDDRTGDGKHEAYAALIFQPERIAMILTRSTDQEGLLLQSALLDIE